MEKKSHVAQVADELVKHGFTAEEADLLAREKHRALVDTLKGGRKTAGAIAEEIVQSELESDAATPATEASKPAADALSAFEASIPEDR